jgi:hypothetical protein
MMPHSRRERTRILRLSHLIMLVVVSMLATACGPFSDDEGEPTSTESTISQPTSTSETTFVPDSPDVTVTEETTPEPTEEQETAAATGTPAASSTPVDPSTEPAANDQLGPDEATPASETADEASTPVTTGEQATGTETGAESTGPVPTAAAFSGSDGTSGATPISVPRTADNVSTPVSGEGTPEGTPGLAVLEETRSSGSIDLGAIDPVSVDSCSPDNVPILIDGEASYVTNSSVNFRNGPGADCDAIGNGPLGAGVPVQVTSAPVDREGDDFIWVQIRVNDIVGWVVLDALDPA